MDFKSNGDFHYQIRECAFKSMRVGVRVSEAFLFVIYEAGHGLPKQIDAMQRRKQHLCVFSCMSLYVK